MKSADILAAEYGVKATPEAMAAVAAASKLWEESGQDLAKAVAGSAFLCALAIAEQVGPLDREALFGDGAVAERILTHLFGLAERMGIETSREMYAASWDLLQELATERLLAPGGNA